MRADLKDLIIHHDVQIAAAVDKTQVVTIKVTYADGHAEELLQTVQQGQRVIVCIGRAE